MSLIMSHQRRLFQYILALSPHVSDAEDILQETNLVLWRKFEQFQVGTNFFGWAARVAQLEVAKYRKKAAGRRVLALDDGVVDLIADEAARNTEYTDTVRAALQHCLGKLRDDDRDLIARRYTEGASGKRLAEELGRPLNSIYKSLGRIRQALLDCIGRSVSRAVAGGGIE